MASTPTVWTSTTPTSPQTGRTSSHQPSEQPSTIGRLTRSPNTRCSGYRTDWSLLLLVWTACQHGSWFMRLGAPVFSRTLADLINLSVSTSTVPTQWKRTRICPVPKTSNPKQPSDFRPLSVTSIWIIVRDFLYLALDCPLATLCFTDQYAFRPNDSTTDALVARLNSVTQALENNLYVVVVALDFSKVFDTMRHSSSMAKVAQLQLPDCVHNTGDSQLPRRTQSLHAVQRLHVGLTWCECQLRTGFCDRSRHVRRQRRGFAGRDVGQQSDEVRWRHLPGDTRLQRGQSRQKNFQRRRVVAGQQPHVKPGEICRGHFARQPEAMYVAFTRRRRCRVSSVYAQSTRRLTHRQTVCHCARGWRRQLVCEVHVRHQRITVSRHGGVSSAAGVPRGRRLQAH